MTITFYNTSDAYNIVNKKLIYVNSFNNLPLKKNMDILNPIFEMTFKSDYVEKINFMYIEDFKRYYFVKSKILTGGRCEISGEVDVLMSFASEIKQNSAWIERCVNYNNYIYDSKLKQSELPIVFARKFEGIVFNEPHYIIVANGKGE